jgi:hypothetical protein
LHHDITLAAAGYAVPGHNHIAFPIVVARPWATACRAGASAVLAPSGSAGTWPAQALTVRDTINAAILARRCVVCGNILTEGRFRKTARPRLPG